MALKLDIVKAFDTIEWTFLTKTLKAFGFFAMFISWIKVIIELAHLSILLNVLLVDILVVVEG